MKCLRGFVGGGFVVGGRYCIMKYYNKMIINNEAYRGLVQFLSIKF